MIVCLTGLLVNLLYWGLVAILSKGAWRIVQVFMHIWSIWAAKR